MKTQKLLFIISLISTLLISINGFTQTQMKYNKLTPEEESVIIDKGTERPWSGKYVDFKEDGTYTCKRCGAPLYRSTDKFDSHCGWPSFDDAIPGAVKKIPDADGMRTEIVCANCGAHLGHVFTGEGFTPKDTRYCVNSVSLDFTPAVKAEEKTTDTAYFAGGCFWGTEYFLQKEKGVKSTTVGYMGGKIANPTYREVCYDNTGYAETVQVVFDPKVISYEQLAKYFFDIHDPTQVDRQGPDVGDQYRSEIFYVDENQKQAAQKLIKQLENKGYKVATILSKADKFWPAEDYHQDYYEHKGGTPYCHRYTDRF
jgi:peptide methionine sulfoxide reductase msrA/msrB